MKNAAIAFVIALVLGFVALRIVGERYRINITDGRMLLHDNWTGHVYGAAETVWYRVK